MKARVSLKCFVTDCLWKHIFDFSSSQTPSNLTSMRTLVTLRLINLEQLSCIKGQKFAFLDNCFADLFTVVENCY